MRTLNILGRDSHWRAAAATWLASRLFWRFPRHGVGVGVDVGAVVERGARQLRAATLVAFPAEEGGGL